MPRRSAQCQYATPGLVTKAPTITLISESGLYKLVMRARQSNPKAREFQNWVTGAVLPRDPQGRHVRGR